MSAVTMHHDAQIALLLLSSILGITTHNSQHSNTGHSNVRIPMCLAPPYHKDRI